MRITGVPELGPGEVIRMTELGEVARTTLMTGEGDAPWCQAADVGDGGICSVRNGERCTFIGEMWALLLPTKHASCTSREYELTVLLPPLKHCGNEVGGGAEDT